jgi:hypothetical protein
MVVRELIVKEAREIALRIVCAWEEHEAEESWATFLSC